jgi:hypothetical protein
MQCFLWPTPGKKRRGYRDTAEAEGGSSRAVDALLAAPLGRRLVSQSPASKRRLVDRAGRGIAGLNLPPLGHRQENLTLLERQDILTTMVEPGEVVAQTASEDPEVGLRGVASLRALLEAVEELQVRRARELGWSWQQIAALLGVSKQAVHQKYGKGEPRRRRRLR